MNETDRLEKTPHQRLHYVHYLRGIAVLIVVAAHCSTIFADETLVRQYYFGTLFRHINLIFVFISGFLFAYLAQRFEYHTYLKKKFLHVILPYLVISVPAFVMYFMNPHPHPVIDTSYLNHVEIVLIFLATGAHLEPLWFIPMMAIFYLMSPVFRCITLHPKSYALFPLALMLAVYIGRPDYSIGPIQNFFFYLPVYLFGMIACHFRDKWLPVVADNLLIINALWIIPIMLPATAGNDTAIYLSKYCFCLGVLGMLYKFALFSASNLLSRLADMSFGIFFVHGYLVGITHMMITGRQSDPMLILYVLYFTLIVAFSACVVLGMQKMLGRRSRLFIGS